MRNHKIINVFICFMLLLSISVFAVSDAEVKKMADAMPDKPVVAPTAQRTMLVFSLCKGFKHSSVPYWAKALDIMSEKTGAFKVVHSNDMSVFSADSLKQFDVICLNNTTKLVPDSDEQKAILDFIKSGKGLVGIHAATDSHYDWPEYVKLVGGWFDGHPWNEEVAIRIEVPDHPASEGIESPWRIADEIYQHRDWNRDEMCVVMSLDPDGTNMQKQGMKREDGDYGIAWCRPYGEGRSFYTALGHRNEVFDDPLFQKHLLNAVLWAMGESDFECEPHPMPE